MPDNDAQKAAAAKAAPDGVVQVSVAIVNTTNGQVELRQGDKLPANLADGELERLKAAGVFDKPVRSNPYSVAQEALNALPDEIPGE